MNITDALLLVAIAAAPAPSPGMAITGTAVVIDGDTIVINRIPIRLFGIDAPEAKQRCTDGSNATYNCGQLAASVLEEEIAGALVTCLPINTDKYQRVVAVCAARGRDLGDVMVRRGYAVDYPFFSGGRYSSAEREAADARRGMWAGSFITPSLWRRENKP